MRTPLEPGRRFRSPDPRVKGAGGAAVSGVAATERSTGGAMSVRGAMACLLKQRLESCRTKRQEETAMGTKKSMASDGVMVRRWGGGVCGHARECWPSRGWRGRVQERRTRQWKAPCSS